jgi:plastocyanin
MKNYSILLFTATLSATLAACSSSKDEPSTLDAAMTIVDAPAKIVDAPTPLGTDPAMLEVPCDGNEIVNVEYYSCAFFIGDNTMRVGQTVRFTGCENHQVTSVGGKVLVASGTKVCFKITTVGELKFSCTQHPANSGVMLITP